MTTATAWILSNPWPQRARSIPWTCLEAQRGYEGTVTIRWVRVRAQVAGLFSLLALSLTHLLAQCSRATPIERCTHVSDIQIARELHGPRLSTRTDRWGITVTGACTNVSFNARLSQGSGDQRNLTKTPRNLAFQQGPISSRYSRQTFPYCPAAGALCFRH